MVTKRKAAAAKPTVASPPVAALPYELKPGMLITFRPKSMAQFVSRLANTAGIKNVAFAADFASQAVDMEQTRHAGMTVFNNIGVAVANLDPNQEASIAAISTDD